MQYGYSNPWGMALQQPMGGLMSPFTPWGLGAMGGQPQEAMATRGVRSMDRREESGESPGFSTPGDPSKAAQTSQATRDRVRDSVVGSMAKNTAMSTLGALGSYAAGMPGDMVGQAALGGLMGPSSIGNVIGGGLNAALGTQPSGFVGKTIGYAAPAIGGLLGGPIGALAGGIFGGVLGDVVGDKMNTRDQEAVRDSYEGEGFANQARGRMAFADRLGLEKADLATGVSFGSLPSSIASLQAMDKAIANIAAMERSYGITPSHGLTPGQSSKSYGGWGNVGGPEGGARSVDRGYGPSMGGFAGLGIGNPSSHGGGSSGSSSGSGRGVGGLGRGDSTGTGGGFGDGKGGVSGL